NFLVHSS
nr:Chain A, NFLVHSS heptapeptide from Islet Amyloid Polypeptide [Homo sapiens]3FTH_B Chain B, NFLVHSS heptapeptide from Islet Amyloid Polypeptide [Homo sapiens]